MAVNQLTAVAGGLPVRDLTPQLLSTIVGTIRSKYNSNTAYAVRGALRRLLRWMETSCGLPAGTADTLAKAGKPIPRLTTATDTERAKLLDLASASMRFFIHLCADMGLRHRTAAGIALKHYNPTEATLTFTTKMGVQQTLPVTAEIKAILQMLLGTTDPALPILDALDGKTTPRKDTYYRYRQWKRLLKTAGITTNLKPHDLRRSGAEAVWKHTKDLRKCQAFLGHTSVTTTAWYLANLTHVDELRPAMQAAATQRDKQRSHIARAASREEAQREFNHRECQHCGEVHPDGWNIIVQLAEGTVAFCSDFCVDTYKRNNPEAN